MLLLFAVVVDVDVIVGAVFVVDVIVVVSGVDADVDVVIAAVASVVVVAVVSSVMVCVAAVVFTQKSPFLHFLDAFR